MGRKSSDNKSQQSNNSTNKYSVSPSQTIHEEKKRVGKRNKSQYTFIKKNLTLEIEEINKDNEEGGEQPLATFQKKIVNDSQEDSPIR